MSPLQAMGLGLVVVALDAVSTVDLLPDFLGWAVVGWGVSRLALEERMLLWYAAVLAGVVALVVWVPAVHTALSEAELALKWAASLPELLFLLVCARTFSRAARASGDRKFAGRFGIALWLTLAVAVVPPIADAAGSEALLEYGDLAFVLLWLWMVWNLFAAHNRPWARPSG